MLALKLIEEVVVGQQYEQERRMIEITAVIPPETTGHTIVHHATTAAAMTDVLSDRNKKTYFLFDVSITCFRNESITTDCENN